MAFLEDTIFPEDISYGSDGGPGYSTDIVVMSSGHEARNANWAAARYVFNAAYGVKTLAQMRALIALFHTARGRLHGFRYKDWADYQAIDEPITLTGAKTYPLSKIYGSGAQIYTRTITKPRAGATFKRNGGAYATPSVDTTIGIATLMPDVVKAITAITKASPGKVTVAAHGYTTGSKIYLTGIGGMTQLNGQVVTITVVDVDNFTIGLDTTAYTTYTSGGSAEKYPQPSETLTWSGVFDVPVRFDTDRLSSRFDDYESNSTSVPLVEIRRP